MKTAPYGYSKRLKPVKTEAFDTYWRFAATRQKIFFARLNAEAPPWTDDPVLKIYKFTNAYRASDRVSQYLIREAIYSKSWSLEDTVFRILLFKLFNKIETWELLEHHFGSIESDTYDVDEYDNCLNKAKASGASIYSAAYIMPAGPRAKTRTSTKHRFHLQLLKELIDNKFHIVLAKQDSLEQLYNRLLEVESLGPFLAYQYSIDLNYSPWFNFSENGFVMPGPGAKDGIRKCFSDLREYSEEDIIYMMQDEQEYHFANLDIDFETLWGRPLHLIDCQNLFCEVDKYSRVVHPYITGISGRTRIKQKYQPMRSPAPAWYPPKWDLNKSIEERQVNAQRRL